MKFSYFNVRYALPTLVWALLIFIMSSIPGRSLPEVDLFSFDKIAHFLVFGVLGYLNVRWFHFLRNTPVPFFRYYVFFSLGIVILYAGLDEIHQFFVPNRTCSWFDFAADVLGIVVAHVVFVKVVVKKGIRILT